VEKNMKKVFFVLILCVVPIYAQTTLRDLVKNPDPFHGTLTARVVAHPTRAALDMAAWVNNSLLASPGVAAEELPRTQYLEAMDLRPGNVFSRIEDQASGMGLSKSSLQSPLAFMAVKRAATVELHWDVLGKIHERLAKIPGLRASRLFIQPPTKQVPWKKKGPKTFFWIQVDLAPGTQGAGVRDDDQDGYPEYFGQVNSELLGSGFAGFENWVNQVYAAQELNDTQILDWAQQLASYWYPSYNTDLVWDLPETGFPSAKGDSLFLKMLGGQIIEDASLVIRGNPLGIPHFTVIAIPGKGPLAQRGGGEPAVVDRASQPEKSQPAKYADRQLPENYLANMERVGQELQQNGESFSAWDASLLPQRNAWSKFQASLPAGQMGFEGKNGWLFFRKSLGYTVGGDLSKQDSNFLPLPALIEFKGVLEAAEVNMLFVPVPPKTEVYPELLPQGDSSLIGKIINPWSRKFIRDAQDEGMEVMDLLPEYIAHRRDSGKLQKILYQKDDTHWTREGMMIAAEQLARRIQQYSWYAELKPNTSRFSSRDTLFSRLGDIVERLPADRQALYPAVELNGSRVYVNDSVPYAGGKGAPIILIGDSFTGVMESVDCHNGGVGAHIARLTGLDVEVITSWGGGPNVRQKFLKARKAQLESARLVIYMMTARDLYQYPEGWEALETP
jgi:alginate O-acetyltransferase complex protein AlgJ